MRSGVRSYVGDPALLGLVLVLSLFGVAMIYSAGQVDVPDPATVGAWRGCQWWRWPWSSGSR